MSFCQIELVWVRVRLEWECFWVNLREDNKCVWNQDGRQDGCHQFFCAKWLNPRWQNSSGWDWISLRMNEWSFFVQNGWIARWLNHQVSEWMSRSFFCANGEPILASCEEWVWEEKLRWLNPRWHNSRWLTSSRWCQNESWVRLN